MKRSHTATQPQKGFTLIDRRAAKRGFTLIELSIVLVIIGLIVGGVLVGQDLIKAAELRATIGQLEKYNAAVNTFRGKYGSIPGDMVNTQASSFGLFFLNATGTGAGDGNGLVESTSAGQPTMAIGEPLLFWRHLSDANLIDGAFGSSGNSAILPASGAVTADVSNISQSLPPAKMGRGNYLSVYSPTGATDGSAGTNYYELNSVMTIADDGQIATQTSSQMSPREAYNIDGKVDDGFPNTGNVRAKGPASAGALNRAPATTCAVDTNATTPYTLTSETPTCALRARFN